MKKVVLPIVGLVLLLAGLLRQSETCTSTSDGQGEKSPSVMSPLDVAVRQKSQFKASPASANDELFSSGITLAPISSPRAGFVDNRLDSEASASTFSESGSVSPPGADRNTTPPFSLPGSLTPDDFETLEEVRKVMPSARYSESGRYPPESLESPAGGVE